MAVNLSPGQFRNGRIVETIQRALDDSGLNPQYLGLELTESVLMEGATDTLETLHALAAMGMSLAIDDFGTGYSSLSYLKQFPAHSVKIDRSFIRDVITNPDDVAITSAIVSMGKALNLRIVAEVEGIEQLDLLRRLGCDRVQGYSSGADPLRPHSAEAGLRVGYRRGDQGHELIDLGQIEPSDHRHQIMVGIDPDHVAA